MLLSKLGDQSLPDSVRMILVLNPKESDGSPLTLPPSFLHVTLTTPYRSTIAITSLARFIAKFYNLVVPEGDFGSDVEGTKPTVYDVGTDERKLKAALKHCRKQLGDNATILYHFNHGSIEKQGKKAGGPWDCYSANSFYGWEDERVVVVTNGINLMEMITRARTCLSVILVGDSYSYVKTQEYFQQAADLGLVEKVQLSDDEANAEEGEEEIEDKAVEAVEENIWRIYGGYMEEEISCMSGCWSGCCPS